MAKKSFVIKIVGWSLRWCGFSASFWKLDLSLVTKILPTSGLFRMIVCHVMGLARGAIFLMVYLGLTRLGRDTHSNFLKSVGAGLMTPTMDPTMPGPNSRDHPAMV